MFTQHANRKGDVPTVDVFAEYDKTSENIDFFENKKFVYTPKQLPSLNGSSLGLWAWAEAHLQKQLHNKATRLANKIEVITS